MKHRLYLSVIVVLLFLAPGMSPHADVGTASPSNAERESAPDNGGVEITADRIEYREDGEVLICIGNVVITYHDDVLKADYVEVHTETMDAFARGQVEVIRPGTVWTGETLNYNFRTGQGDFGRFQIQRGPFFITAENSERVGEDEYLLHKVMITTCERDAKRREFEVRATSAKLTENRYLRAYNVNPRIASVPFFYLPFIRMDLGADYSRWDVQLGNKGRWGMFALVGYRTRWTDEIETVTHVDTYTKRGVAIGKDILWQAPEYRRQGRLETYYLRDSRPFRNEFEEERFGDDVDQNRYRLRLVHNKGLTPRLALAVDTEYVSDPLVREDFFEAEFRLRSQPENRVSLRYRGDGYVAGILLNMRLNDFYQNVDRLPELSLSHSRQPIVGSRFYYEGSNSLSNLYRRFPSRDERDDYDALRIDSYHQVFYPGKYFGFLNIIPHAGVRATHYSELPPITSTETQETTVIGEDGETVIEEEEITTVVSRPGADTRTFIELGVETSFKAFKRIHDDATVFGNGLRHVTEPYAAYQFRSEPSLLPDELYQFDGIDRIGRLNQIRFGNRNKLQSRRRERVVDLVDVDIHSFYRLAPDPGQKTIGPVGMQSRLRPVHWLEADIDGRYDTQTSQVSHFNSHLRLDTGADSHLHLGYGYRDHEGSTKNLLFANIGYKPTRNWNFNLYGRYNFEKNELEEHYYVVQHKMNCTGWEIGLRALEGRAGEDNEYQLWARMWLLAFPQAQFKMFDITSL